MVSVFTRNCIDIVVDHLGLGLIKLSYITFWDAGRDLDPGFDPGRGRS